MTNDRDPAARLRVTSELEHLYREFDDFFSREEIGQRLEESIASLQGTQVNVYVITIAGRFTRERLRAMAQTAGRMPKHVPEILFVCGKDAGRSQMAAAFSNHLSGGRVNARSAGEHHVAGVHAEVLDAMREIGVDLSEAFPKPVTEEVVLAADIVVTMGCGESTCPYYPGKSYRDWEIVDPAGRTLPEVRAIRDRLRDEVTKLLVELGVPVQRGAAT